jgi:5-hydroxyisourate hydrolase
VITVTTHVLDATRGGPAAGLEVRLGQVTAVTGDDGRALLGEVAPGVHELAFSTGDWFAARGVESFYPSVTVRFAASGEHCHVPLLLSPFAYSTYRGVPGGRPPGQTERGT